MQRLIGQVQNYAWGSTELLANLRGEAESAEPEAEVWFGAHDRAASTFSDGSTLLAAINSDPVGQLGHSIVDRFGPQLPFLVKLLAANSPLSIQAHPSIEQAVAGFAAEEAAGIASDAFERSFKDDNHKPELICALTPFDALVGFRPVERTVAFFEAIGWHSVVGPLTEEGPTHVVEGLLRPSSWGAGKIDVHDMIEQLVGACDYYSWPEWEAEAGVICRLAKKYPGDPGIGIAALLNFVTLQPGEALYLGAGNLHAYVGGLAVEIMANSDNVLRGGLTPKHIDVDNLLDVALPDTFLPELIQPDVDGRYQTPAPEFELRRLDNGQTSDVHGPSIVLCTNGELSVVSGEQTLTLQPTEACWVGVNERATVISDAGATNEGVGWQASAGAVTTLVGG